MNNPYGLYSWREHWREEALAEARVRHIAERAKASHAGFGASDCL